MFDKYLKITFWLMKRYTKNGALILEKGGIPGRYSELERMAWDKYIK